MAKFLLALTLVASMGYCDSSVAQQPAAPVPVYDAVVIKLNNGATRGMHINMDDTTFQATNVGLKPLLVNAFGIREGQIVGLPGWADSMRYDIYAKVTDPDLKIMRSLSREQRSAMIAAILADRFHLQTHIEIKTLPVYELVVAKGGPKLTVSKVPQDPANPDRPGDGDMDVHNTTMTATGVTLSSLAMNLSFPLDRTVIDKTGLTKRYDFQLQWTPSDAANVAADAPPDLFTAIQEQLGLKLQSAKGPVKMLVIDHIDQPTEN